MTSALAGMHTLAMDEQAPAATTPTALAPMGARRRSSLGRLSVGGRAGIGGGMVATVADLLSWMAVFFQHVALRCPDKAEYRAIAVESIAVREGDC